jgi:hypothetical protein
VDVIAFEIPVDYMSYSVDSGLHFRMIMHVVAWAIFC